MQYVFGLLLLFMIGATLGWCLELVYRRFVSSKKWINPGFLNGPYLPLYGFGVCLLYGICSIPMPLWAQIVFIVVMMTVIEYIAGLIFIVGMHIKLWDYSKQWGNIQGIICPLYSLFWGALGVLFLFFVYPFLHHAVGDVGGQSRIPGGQPCPAEGGFQRSVYIGVGLPAGGKHLQRRLSGSGHLRSPL